MLKKRTLLGAALAAVLVSSASATLLVYEGFNYGLSDNAALNTSFGWQSTASTATNTPWQFDTTSLAAPFAGATGASLPAATGGALQIAGGGQTGYKSTAWGTLTNSTTYWYSFILNTYGTGTTFGSPSGGDTPRGTFNIFANTINANNPQNGFGINISNTGVLAAGSSTGGTTTTGITITPATGLYSILGRLVVDGSGNATNTVWVNPTNVSSVGTLGAGASVGGSISTNSTAAAFGGRSFGGSSGYRVDEIRVGTDLIDVVSAIPEPSSFAALAGLSVLGMVGSRRRRQA